MLDQERLIRDIAKKRGMDYRLVRTIVGYPMKFAKAKMSDLADDRPVRIRYFGAFVHKHLKSKKYRYEKKVSLLLENIEEVAIMMTTILGFQLVNFESARTIITSALDTKDYEKIELIWKEWESYGLQM